MGRNTFTIDNLEDILNILDRTCEIYNIVNIEIKYLSDDPIRYIYDTATIDKILSEEEDEVIANIYTLHSVLYSLLHKRKDLVSFLNSMVDFPKRDKLIPKEFRPYIIGQGKILNKDYGINHTIYLLHLYIGRKNED